MNKRFKKTSILCLLLVGVITISGCGNGNEKDEKTASVDTVTENIKGKYAKNENYEYTDPSYDLERDYAFEFTLNFDPSTVGDSWMNVIQIYSDSALSEKVNYLPTWNKEGDWSKGNDVSIAPGRNAKYAIPDDERGGYLFDQGEYADWGNAQQYYLVKYYDLKTGEKLAKPLVTAFTIKTEIKDTPNAEFYVSDDGIAGLKWDKIKGAKEYIVFEYSVDHENPSATPLVTILDTTKETKWEDENTEDASKNNWNFRTVFGNSEDDAYNVLKKQLEKGDIDKEQFLANSKYNGESEVSLAKTDYIGVVAVNDEGTSKLSDTIDVRSVASQVPIRAASYMNEGGIKLVGDNTKVAVEKEINLVSSHVWVVMGDGTITQKLVNYKADEVKESRKTVTFFKEDETGNAVLDEEGNPVYDRTETIPVLSVPFTVEGTAIKGYAEIENYNKKTYKEELKGLKKRQEGLKDKTGGINKNIDLNAKVDKDNTSSDEIREDGYHVFASNALSEYLAIQMLNGQTKVNLDAFKESSDQKYLVDAWYEAMYQNPLTLGVKGISLDRKGNNLTITYDQDASTQRTKQKEIQEKVTEISKEIIKDGMSDLEKEDAINKYLCEHAEYDDAALENAEKNNFKKVDKKFNDSFTAYGILIDNKGVCAGYAAAFKLLADEANLESIIVTGYLDGSLPHAWNRVKIGDEWMSIDSTNNANEYASNALFNIPDSISNKVLVEDDLFMMNSELPKYVGKSENNEYYRQNSKYFTTEAITGKLVESLKNNESVSLRTDYNLSDDEFYAIAKKVAEQTNNPNLQGTYFLGVIYLEK